MSLKKSQIEAEYESFGVQMRPAIRKALRVAAAQRDLEIRDALQEAVLAWASVPRPAKDHADVQRRVMDFLRNPPDETYGAMVSVLMKFIFGGEPRPLKEIEAEYERTAATPAHR